MDLRLRSEKDEVVVNVVEPVVVVDVDVEVANT